MKKFFASTILVASLIFAGTASAQSQQTVSPQQRAQVVTQKMQTVLNLSQSQTSRVQALEIKHLQDVDKMRREVSGSREDQKKAFQTLKKQHDTDLQLILTKNQYQQWQAYLDEISQNGTSQGGRLRTK